LTLCSRFVLIGAWYGLVFKIVKLDAGRTEVIAQIDNFAVRKAAFMEAITTTTSRP